MEQVGREEVHNLRKTTPPRHHITGNCETNTSQYNDWSFYAVFGFLRVLMIDNDV